MSFKEDYEFHTQSLKDLENKLKEEQNKGSKISLGLVITLTLIGAAIFILIISPGRVVVKVELSEPANKEISIDTSNEASNEGACEEPYEETYEEPYEEPYEAPYDTAYETTCDLNGYIPYRCGGCIPLYIEWCNIGTDCYETLLCCSEVKIKDTTYINDHPWYAVYDNNQANDSYGEYLGWVDSDLVEISWQ